MTPLVIYKCSNRDTRLISADGEYMAPSGSLVFVSGSAKKATFILKDGSVSNSDYSPLWENEAGSRGYLNSDYNLKGQTENMDKNEYWVPNIGKGIQVLN